MVLSLCPNPKSLKLHWYAKLFGNVLLEITSKLENEKINTKFRDKSTAQWQISNNKMQNSLNLKIPIPPVKNAIVK